MMFKLGLTGSIGMGKSTTAQMFADLGCSVWDADAAVHRLYAKGGSALTPIKAAFPSAIENGEVSRVALRRIISEDPTALKQIEQIVHPLVRRDREDFTRTMTGDIAVYDIPLLFEGGGEDEFDAVATVLVDAETQRDRVMSRGTLTDSQFDLILSKQMLAEEKASRADYIIRTDTLESARHCVEQIVSEIRGKTKNARDCS